MSDIFEQATRLKLRYETHRGVLSVEDLWDLDLISSTKKVTLDSLAVTLYKEIKSSDEVSFVSDNSKKNDILQLKFDVVKHILDIKLEEKNQAKIAAERAQKKRKLLELISEKENEAFSNQSIEELRKQLAEL